MNKLLFVIFLLVLANCTKEEITSRPHPRVHTSEATDIDVSHATFHGEVTFSNTEIIDHGFIWSESSAQAIDRIKISLGARKGTGAFTATIDTVLKEGQSYNVTAFAQTADYIVYGEVRKFTGVK